MHRWDRVFPHVAAYTFAACNLAGTACMGRALVAARLRMATDAHFVVISSIFHAAFVGIVAGYAGESGVAISPAATLLQAVGRKPQDESPCHITAANVSRGTVTSTAEIHGVIRTEARRIENQCRGPGIRFKAHLRYMLPPGAVAGLTGDA